MFTTDLSLKEDPAYRKISKRFLENPEEFEDAFAKAWFKLTHRDMGPRARYAGSDVPDEVFIWQDPVPEADYEMIDDGDVAELKARILVFGVHVPSWSARPGPRLDLPRLGHARWRQRCADPPGAAEDWEVNDPKETARVIKRLERIQKDFNKAQRGDKRVSLADLIVLAGSAAVEQAAKNAGYTVDVPFTPGRTDATQEQTDVEVLLLPRAARRRLPQLLQRAGLPLPGQRPRGQGRAARPDGAGNGRAGRRSAHPGRERRWCRSRRVHGPDGCAGQRLLRQPAGHEHVWRPSQDSPMSSKAAIASPVR
jgi:hypothetical protein